MAQKGYLDQLLNVVPVEWRYALRSALYYMLDNHRWGTGGRAENGQLYRFESTTAATANAEFTIRHGLGVIPTQLIPVLPLSDVNAQLVPLQVSRAADATRVYLKSTSTGAVITVFLET